MSLFPEIVLASNNAGKIKEFAAFFAPYNMNIVSQKTLNIPKCDEPHGTFIENALAKARHAAKLSGKPALADDSGICADALGGKPGIHSARFAGEQKSDKDNNAKLSEMLQPFDNKKVYYACSLVLVRHELDPMPIIAEGVWNELELAQIQLAFILAAVQRERAGEVPGEGGKREEKRDERFADRS